MRNHAVTFDSFIQDTPEKTHARKQATNAAGSLKNIIMLGNYGTGKTLLANCICNSFENASVMTVNKIARNFRTAMMDRHPNGFSEFDLITRVKALDYLVIDDVGAKGISDYESSVISEIIDIRYAEGKPTGITSNLNITALKEALGERTVDRLKDDGGLFAVFNWGSQRG